MVGMSVAPQLRVVLVIRGREIEFGIEYCIDVEEKQWCEGVVMQT